MRVCLSCFRNFDQTLQVCLICGRALVDETQIQANKIDYDETIRLLRKFTQETRRRNELIPILICSSGAFLVLGILVGLWVNAGFSIILFISGTLFFVAAGVLSQRKAQLDYNAVSMTRSVEDKSRLIISAIIFWKSAGMTIRNSANYFIRYIDLIDYSLHKQLAYADTRVLFGLAALFQNDFIESGKSMDQTKARWEPILSSLIIRHKSALSIAGTSRSDTRTIDDIIQAVKSKATSNPTR